MFFWNLDSDSIFTLFWRHLGTPKTWIFAFFSYFLLVNFEAFFGRRKKLEKIAFFRISGGPGARIDGVREPLGRDLEMGLRTSELRLMRLAKINDKFHDSTGVQHAVPSRWEAADFNAARIPPGRR